jgi:hypothetical protein
MDAPIREQLDRHMVQTLDRRIIKPHDNRYLIAQRLHNTLLIHTNTMLARMNSALVT